MLALVVIPVSFKCQNSQSVITTNLNDIVLEFLPLLRAVMGVQSQKQRVQMIIWIESILQNFLSFGDSNWKKQKQKHDFSQKCHIFPFSILIYELQLSNLSANLFKANSGLLLLSIEKVPF